MPETGPVCRYGPAVPQTQREAAGKAILVVAILWLLSIVVGGWLHLGTHAQPNMAKAHISNALSFTVGQRSIADLESGEMDACATVRLQAWLLSGIKYTNVMHASARDEAFRILDMTSCPVHHPD